jgi:hypothetical protein
MHHRRPRLPQCGMSPGLLDLLQKVLLCSQPSLSACGFAPADVAFCQTPIYF